jgi:H2-forming N5,N10-methylenetetrahydromethanopterin dehydrogenase-like enzyme
VPSPRVLKDLVYPQAPNECVVHVVISFMSIPMIASMPSEVRNRINKITLQTMASSSHDDGLADAICAGSSFLVQSRKETLDQAASRLNYFRNRTFHTKLTSSLDQNTLATHFRKSATMNANVARIFPQAVVDAAYKRFIEVEEFVTLQQLVDPLTAARYYFDSAKCTSGQK